MNKTTAQTVALLTAAYPRQEFPEDSMRLYVQMLADIPEPELAAAVTRLVRRSTWLPSIAEIRIEAAEAKLALPSAGAAWEQATGRGDMHPVVREAYDAAGGSWAFRTSEAPGVLRAQFTKDYLVRRQEALLVAAEAHPAPPPLPVEVSPDAHGRLGSHPVYVLSGSEIDPVAARVIRRRKGEPVGPASEEERQDAIIVLGMAATDHLAPEALQITGGPLHKEAQMIMDEASRE